VQHIILIWIHNYKHILISFQLETCFDLDERLKIRRALRKIRIDQVAAPKVVPELPKAPSSIQKALSLRDDRLKRRCSLTRRRVSKGDLDCIKRAAGHTSDERSEDSDDQQPVTKLNGTEVTPQNDLRVPATAPIGDINGRSDFSAPKAKQSSQRTTNEENGIPAVAPRKSSIPERGSIGKTDNRPLSLRRVSEPQAQVRFTPSGDLVNGDSSSDRNVNGFNRHRRSITFGDPNAHSLLIRKSTDPNKEDRNLDEIDNLLELNTIVSMLSSFVCLALASCCLSKPH
jgi:hypothetical protein